LNLPASGTSGDGTAGSGAAPNEAAGNEAAGNEAAGNEAAGSGAAGSEAAGSGVVTAPRLMNIANALTVLRLALVPVCVVLLVDGGSGFRAAAFVAFAVASVTDLLDGELARRRNLITDFGKIADPIADKALTGSALVTLSALGELPWWVTAVILARELAVTALRFWVIRRGVIAASRGGKLKTLLQVIAISLYILPWHIGLERRLFMGAAVVVTVLTGIDYTVRAVRLHRAVPGQPAGTGPVGTGPAGTGSAGTGSAGAGPASTGSAGTKSGNTGHASTETNPPDGPAPNLFSATGDSAASEPATNESAGSGDSPGGSAGWSAGGGSHDG
jgi:CDP-diacylglycerol--glycerol-3-phosphate 3-phosphatidyltransferase